jgi:hypothetical protein
MKRIFNIVVRPCYFAAATFAAISMGMTVSNLSFWIIPIATLTFDLIVQGRINRT